MTKADHARSYIIEALSQGPHTAKQHATGAGISIEYMRGIIHAALDAGTISAERTGPWFTYYIGDTAPKRIVVSKRGLSIPTKTVIVRPLSIAGEDGKAFMVTLPKEPWEVHA